MGICISKNNKNDCPICLNYINNKDKYITPCCKKCFHYNCIYQWNRKNKACPLCRKGFFVTKKYKVKRRKRRLKTKQMNHVINSIL